MQWKYFEEQRLKKSYRNLFLFQVTYHLIVMGWLLQTMSVKPFQNTLETFSVQFLIAVLILISFFLIGKVRPAQTGKMPIVELLILTSYFALVFFLFYLTNSAIVKLLLFIPTFILIMKYGQLAGLAMSFYAISAVFLIEVIVYYSMKLDYDLGNSLLLYGVVLLITWLTSSFADNELEARRNLFDIVQKHSFILENHDHGVVYLDNQGVVQVFNHMAEIILGILNADIVGKKVHELTLLKPDLKVFQDIFSSAGDNQEKEIFLTYDEKDLLISHYALIDQEKQYMGKVFLIKDLTQSILVHSLQQKYAFVTNSLNMPILVYSKDGFLIYHNQAALGHFSFKELHFLPKLAVELPCTCEFSKFVVEMVKNPEEVYNKEIKAACNEKIRELLVSVGIDKDIFGKVRSITFLINDVTEMRARERQLIHADKMTTVGELAAGLAHEIRNPLASIRGFAQLIQARVEEDSTKANLGILIQEVDRANSMIKDFLAFARPAEPVFIWRTVSQTANEIYKLMEGQCLLKNIMFYSEVISNEESAPVVYWDHNQIKQVILNLVNNAIYAMEDSPVKILYLDYLVLKDKVAIKVKDTGIGIEESMLENLWIPFVTTKTDGTGIGLSICYRIVESHCGRISIESKVDWGTVVTVELPVNPKEAV
ncbi:MAG: ATP-binding protein [Bacillota bacterium]